MTGKLFSSRRWLRYSLRSLFVLTTVVAIWLGYRYRQARRARAIIREMGGCAAI